MKNYPRSTCAGQYGVPLRTPTPESEHLRFGHESQAYYTVPLGTKDLDATLGRPKELSEADHSAFDRQVLMQLQTKLQRAVDALLRQHPDLAEQRHVQPDLRVYQPGTYTSTQHGSLSQTLTKQYIGEHRVSLALGSERFELTFPSSATNMQTTRRAVNRLLEQILRQSETVEPEPIATEPVEPIAV